MWLGPALDAGFLILCTGVPANAFNTKHQVLEPTTKGLTGFGPFLILHLVCQAQTQTTASCYQSSIGMCLAALLFEEGWFGFSGMRAEDRDVIEKF